MTVKMSRPQAEFIFSKSPHPAFLGGFGAGKSQAGTMRLTHLITQDPGIDVSHFFPTYRLAKRRGFAGTLKYLKSLGFATKVNKQDLTINLCDLGSTFYFETFSDPDAIVAFEVAHAVIDELDILPKDDAQYVWQKVTERVRQSCVGLNTLGCVTTPDQGTAGFCYEKWRTGENLSDGYHYIKAGTRSNKFLPVGYADQIAKNYDPIAAEAFLNGGWVSFNQNKVYHFFNRVKHHSPRAITKDDTVLHVGLDFNIGGCCAVTFVIDANNPVAVDEFTSYDTRDFVNNLTRYKGKKVIVYPDASGAAGRTNASQSDISIIREAGFQLNYLSQNPAVRDRINAYNGLLAHNRLLVNTDKCPNLTNALETQGYDKHGDPEKWNAHPAIDDWADSSGYFIAHKFPIGRAHMQLNVGGVR